MLQQIFKILGKEDNSTESDEGKKTEEEYRKKILERLESVTSADSR